MDNGDYRNNACVNTCMHTKHTLHTQRDERAYMRHRDSKYTNEHKDRETGHTYLRMHTYISYAYIHTNITCTYVQIFMHTNFQTNKSTFKNID